MHRPILLSAFLVAALAAPPALAKPPAQGTSELRLGAGSPDLFGQTSPSGLFRLQEDERSVTLFGLAAGYGYFVADGVELGFDFTLINQDGDATIVGFSPVFKLLGAQGRTGFFGQLSPGFLVLSNGSSDTVFRLGVAVGLEAFVTDWWALRLGPTYEVFVNEGETLHAFGASWGISAYF